MHCLHSRPEYVFSPHSERDGSQTRENLPLPGTRAALMPGDDPQPLTLSRMSQRHGKEGLLTPSKELLSSPSLNSGVSYGHGKVTGLLPVS
ncbi:hypothetical protein AAFF_G00323140 [Aldrovandia affinis]|uniref:Uncharacterized protein n=1 Tax=Aldrovandia affinis TaxID=143900 RepID=A0AAD7SMR2_9TELE|nr:hypothetical protein AAFF_G00323140 [Aldrovandia affinis]